MGNLLATFGQPRDSLGSLGASLRIACQQLVSDLFIYSRCTAKECIYTHTHTETPEEKEPTRPFTISSRSRSQAPAPNETLVCRYWKAANCTHGRDCKDPHPHTAAPFTEVADGEKRERKSSTAKRRDRRKRSQTPVSSSSSAPSASGKMS